MVFQTVYSTKFCSLEKQDAANTKTETAGYRTAQQQIESFLIAGQSLQAGREAMYNDEDDIEDEDYTNDVDTSDNDLLELSPAAILAAREVKKVSVAIQRELSTSAHDDKPESPAGAEKSTGKDDPAQSIVNPVDKPAD